ncbi:unnamed protein product [Lymnaea stagnalis]|uniref:Death domain-containing protein n=1 Tax=Lymnaea stagnalis TaxID=6523 RepID=A0AAV2HDK2_LYMST
MTSSANNPALQQKKEPAVLNHASLVTLARGIGKEDLKGLEFIMYLNIPAKFIINCAAEITETPLTAEGSEYNKMAVTQSCLMYWKELTKDTKTKERLKSLERALREIGKGDIADQVLENHQANQELSSEIFA